MLQLIVLSLFIIFLTVCVRRLLSLRAVHSKIKHIPGVVQLFELFPIKIPFLSSYYYLTSLDDLERACDLYGDKETKTLRISTSSTPLVFISDPKLLKEFFITKGNLFDKQGYELVRYFGEDNILTAINTEKWKKHYKICSPAFTPRNLKYVCKVSANSCDLLFEKWYEKINVNGSIVLDVSDYANLTLDILGKAAFNIDFGFFSQNKEGIIFRQHMEKLISPSAVLSFIFLGSVPFLYNFVNKLNGVQEATDGASSFLDRVIEERTKLLSRSDLSNSDEVSDLLSLLVDSNLKEETLSRNELKSNTLLLSTAGHETTAKSITWISYRLSKDHELQRKLWKEVDEVLQGRSPTYDDVPSLPFVNAIIMESLRLNPPVYHLERVASKNLTLGKFEIPKGTAVHAFMSHVQKREDIWENATEFKPERFLDPKIKNNYQHDYTYAAFSLGNRQCLGKNFALLEACIILTKLAQQYEFKLLNDETVDPVTVFQLPVARPSSNMKIQITKRKL